MRKYSLVFKSISACPCTRSFWNISIAAIRGEVAKGRHTLVTIQFGHNDQKIAPPESMGANLTEMVREIRDLGAEPVLVTSLTRRNFNSDGTIADTLGPWADGKYTPNLMSVSFRLTNDLYCFFSETILISQQQQTHLLDLHAASIKYVRGW